LHEQEKYGTIQENNIFLHFFMTRLEAPITRERIEKAPPQDLP